MEVKGGKNPDPGRIGFLFNFKKKKIFFWWLEELAGVGVGEMSHRWEGKEETAILGSD